jgi:hypothetical protein
MREALLKPGTYTLGLWVGSQAETIDHIEPATSFTVLTYSEGQRHEHYPGPYIPSFSVRLDDAPATTAAATAVEVGAL